MRMLNLDCIKKVHRFIINDLEITLVIHDVENMKPMPINMVETFLTALEICIVAQLKASETSPALAQFGSDSCITQ